MGYINSPDVRRHVVDDVRKWTAAREATANERRANRARNRRQAARFLDVEATRWELRVDLRRFYEAGGSL